MADSLVIQPHRNGIFLNIQTQYKVFLSCSNHFQASDSLSPAMAKNVKVVSIRKPGKVFLDKRYITQLIYFALFLKFPEVVRSYISYVMFIIRSLDSIFCIISFILIYFSMISIALWCTVLMYAWNISFKSLSTTKDVISGKVRYFHFIVWFFAVVLTNLALMLQQVSDIKLTRFW